MSDQLGDRMKRQYEDRTRYMLPRRTYTIIRCDGKAFHTLTRKLPAFDKRLADAMTLAAWSLCEQAQGACFAYTQSDEINVLLTDFATPQTDAWFDGNAQKICSVAASVVTYAFSLSWRDQAHFDARVFTIPDATEVENYFIWRQQDASRNSLQMLAQEHFSARELHGKSTVHMHDMLHDIGLNWNNLTTSEKRGTAIIRNDKTEGMGSSRWTVDYDIPVWTADRSWLASRIPRTTTATPTFVLLSPE